MAVMAAMGRAASQGGVVIVGSDGSKGKKGGWMDGCGVERARALADWQEPANVLLGYLNWTVTTGVELLVTTGGSRTW